MYYYLVREADSQEAMFVIAANANVLHWPSLNRIDSITKAEFETYVAFGITEAKTFHEAYRLYGK